MENKLCKVKLNDLEELADLLVKFWKSQLYNPTDADILEDIRRMIDPKGIGRLILHKGKIAGFIYVNEKFGYLNNIEYLYVDEPFRGLGIATFAINEIKKIILSKGNERVQIEVAPNNIKALKLYHKLGFTCIDTWSLSTEILGETVDINYKGLDFKINPKEVFQNKKIKKR